MEFNKSKCKVKEEKCFAQKQDEEKAGQGMENVKAQWLPELWCCKKWKYCSE